MIEIFTIKFLLYAFIGALLSAISTSMMSVFISLKRIAYMSEALSHISFTGIALALLLGLSVHLISGIFVLIIVSIIGLFSWFYNLEESNITMVLLSVSMALGVLILSFKKDYTVDLASYMFGNILLVTFQDLISMGFLIIVNSLFLLLWYRELIYLTYNFEISGFYHIPAKKIYFLFLILLAVNIVVSVKIAGIIMITAQLILPGMISLNLTKNIKAGIFTGIIASVFSSISGFFLSYHYNFPSGSVIVLVMFGLFLLSAFWKAIEKRKIRYML